MKRFLNGEINKEGEIYENMSKYIKLYRLKPRKTQDDKKSNLNDFIKYSDYYKYEVKNSNFICLFESNKIQILSLKIENDSFNSEALSGESIEDTRQTDEEKGFN